MNLDAARSWAVQQLADALQSVLEAITSVRPEISWERQDGAIPAGTQQDEWLWWALGFTGFPPASIWIGVPTTGVSALGQSALCVPGTDDISAEAARSACRDMFARTADVLAKNMSGLFENPVAANEVATADAPEVPLAGTLVLALPTMPDAATLAVRYDEVFLSRLAEVLPPPTNTEASPLERIADLELPVHATLGSTSIPLRDVFRLMVGSVIDIGKTIADPVDLVVNDRVIARGQVVICNGSYGVKLTQQLTASGGISCRRTS